MGASIVKIAGGVTEGLEGMIKRANLIPAYLDRVVYREYQKAQRTRWMTENNHDDFTGGQWAPLDPAYKAWKKKRYADSPGGGSKTLIRTGRLYSAVIGPSTDHRKIVTNDSLTVSHSVEYGRFVTATRPFDTWSDKFYRRIYSGLVDYVAKNVVKQL